MAPFAKTPIFFTYGDPLIEVSKEPDLTDGWWASEDLFSLERRAIFSKTWICIAHMSRFDKPGDYISLELASFPLLIILGKDHIARAFHNVCRHRAYTITKKPAGSSLVLGCRYHGWSYDTKGNLIKAPQFDGVEGFNKSENGLFTIRACTDRAGFIHVNLDASLTNGAPDCEVLVGFASDHGIAASNRWLTGWELNGGAFNWKTVGASDRTGIGTPSSAITKYTIMEFVLGMIRGHDLDTDVYEVYHAAPNTLIFVFAHSKIWVMMTVIPVSAVQSKIRCDAFSFGVEQYKLSDIESLKTFITSQVQELENLYARLRNELPTDENPYLALLKEHLRLERLAGREIFPGRQDNAKSEAFCKAEKLCNDLDALANTALTKHARVDSMQVGLDW